MVETYIEVVERRLWQELHDEGWNLFSSAGMVVLAACSKVR